MTLIKYHINVPSVDPSRQLYPVNSAGQPLYKSLLNTKFFGESQEDAGLQQQQRFLIESQSGLQVEGNNPVYVAQTVNLIQMSKMFEQLSQLSKVSATLFESTKQHLDKIQQRLDSSAQRVEALKKVIPLVQEKMSSQLLTDGLGNERTDYKNPFAPDQQLFAAGPSDKNGSHLPLAIRDIYRKKCMAPPMLQMLDQFREDGSSSMKHYSYPQFFIEQWRLLMEKEAAKEESTLVTTGAGKKKKKKVKKDGESKKSKAVKAADVQVKRYNKAGELIVDQIGSPQPVETMPQQQDLSQSASPQQYVAQQQFQTSNIPYQEFAPPAISVANYNTPSIPNDIMPQSPPSAMAPPPPPPFQNTPGMSSGIPAPPPLNVFGGFPSTPVSPPPVGNMPLPPMPPGTSQGVFGMPPSAPPLNSPISMPPMPPGVPPLNIAANVPPPMIGNVPPMFNIGNMGNLPPPPMMNMIGKMPPQMGSMGVPPMPLGLPPPNLIGQPSSIPQMPLPMMSPMSGFPGVPPVGNIPAPPVMGLIPKSPAGFDSPMPPAGPPPVPMANVPAAPAFNSPAAPPPPPPPMAMESPVSANDGKLASDLLNQRSGLKSAAQRQMPEPVKKDSRNEMLDGIRGGGVNLRKVTIQTKSAAEAKKSVSGGNDVASILARRVALEASESEGESDDEENDDDWE
ncbi:hypothetical protein MP228_006804 [Amoeboaphelidium protococcarum]|nr:hypothetical protein MP228_006804 [Amoeboaphelidium protococcarum]